MSLYALHYDTLSIFSSCIQYSNERFTKKRFITINANSERMAKTRKKKNLLNGSDNLPVEDKACNKFN